MTHADVYVDKKFHDWRGYEPDEMHYTAYIQDKPELIAAGHKIQDLYLAFCGARATFLRACEKPASNIDELFQIANTVNAAILQYGLCYDLLWQIAWAYVTPSSFDSICNNEPDELEKDCTRDTLISRLNCNIMQNPVAGTIDRKILEWLTKVDSDTGITELRQIYNYIKHRGIIAIPGLYGKQNPMFSLKEKNNPGNTKTIHFLTRKEETILGLEGKIADYHFALEAATDELIALIIPSDYKMQKHAFSDLLSTVYQVAEKQADSK